MKNADQPDCCSKLEVTTNENANADAIIADSDAEITCPLITNHINGTINISQEQCNTVKDYSMLKSDRCLQNALKSEENHQQNAETYFHTVQKDITPPMRKIVVEWMMEVCAEQKCQEGVILLALNYFDRFLSTKSLRKTNLQILGAACLLLASKLREPNCRALSVDLLVFYTDNSIYKEDLIKWELYVLSLLGWDLSTVTALDFLDLLIIRLPISNKRFSELTIEKVRRHAQAFISLAAKEHHFSKYAPSTIAASSIAASMNGLRWHLCSGHNIHFLLSRLTVLTNTEQDQLEECMLQMESIFDEHRHKLQPFLINTENSPSLNGYYNCRYRHKQYQLHRQKPKTTILPKLAQTCKMQAQAQKELQEIKF
ncbi:CycD [Drosophila busckii]|uniref:CycD n=2 Tax=Drosophila busckii TaxID=30019 RepID=A0A0M5J1E9_DROBS|nr:CycD [Drosophila busckii]